MPVPNYLLSESAAGYSLYEVTQSEEIGSRTQEFLKLLTDAQAFRRLVKLVSFVPFKNAAHALENINDISEGMNRLYYYPLLFQEDVNCQVKCMIISRRSSSWIFRREEKSHSEYQIPSSQDQSKIYWERNTISIQVTLLKTYYVQSISMNPSYWKTYNPAIWKRRNLDWVIRILEQKSNSTLTRATTWSFRPLLF